MRPLLLLVLGLVACGGARASAPADAPAAPIVVAPATPAPTATITPADAGAPADDRATANKGRDGAGSATDDDAASPADEIPLGNTGTVGHGAGQGYGSGTGRLGASRVQGTPRIREAGMSMSVSGRLPQEVIRRIVRQNFGRFRMCYENGLLHDAKLKGTVGVKFTIGRDGATAAVADSGSSISDPGVVGCVVGAFQALSFPQPEGGVVTVTYTLSFEVDP